jgi:hypothetical protein
MRREEAEAQRESLQRDDHEHTYGVREKPAGKWDIVRTNIPRPTSHDVVACREAAPPTDAEQSAELADAARRLKALRERRARLANEPPAPPDPGPLIVLRIPGYW